MTIIIRTPQSKALGNVIFVSASEDDFRQQVTAYAYELNQWHGHMRRVKEDADRGIPEANRHQPYPPPHPFGPLADVVRQSVVTNSEGAAEPSYEVVQPIVSIEDKRAKLVRDVEASAAAEHDKVTHYLKRDLLNHKVSEASEVPEARRTDEHWQILKDNALRVKRHAAINLHAAQLKFEIADLTPETIDGWQPKPFQEN